jgi:hypothetical protein
LRSHRRFVERIESGRREFRVCLSNIFEKREKIRSLFKQGGRALHIDDIEHGNVKVQQTCKQNEKRETKEEKKKNIS